MKFHLSEATNVLYKKISQIIWIIMYCDNWYT